MARLLSWPQGLGITSITPQAGPRTTGSSESIGGLAQTVSSPFGLWQIKFAISAMRDAQNRRYRGWVAGLNGGANATRVPYFDPDMMSFAEAGVNATAEELAEGVPWSNGQPWSNNQNWEISRPMVSVGAAVARDTTLVTLANEFWGHGLDVGDYIGFMPQHFGMYVVTQIVATGQYRIWPKLRKALVTSDYATLSPTLAMRMMGENAADVSRELVASNSAQITLTEVMHADVETHFAD